VNAEVAGVVVESVKDPVVASVVLLDVMLIEAFAPAELSMGPTAPLIVAEAPLIVAVPKFASGKIPPDEGASTIHSAEERSALLDVCVVV